MNRSDGVAGQSSGAAVVDSTSVAEGASAHAAARTSRAWLVIALVTFAAFGALTLLVAGRVNLWFDQPLLDLAHGLAGFAALWNFVSDAANYPMIAVGVGIVLWLLKAHRRREAALVVAVLAAATAGSELVKLLVARPRPIPTLVEGVVFSYPSGHVLEALTIFGIIGLLIWRNASPRPVRVAIAVLFTILVVIVGIARVALAAHYPSDVLGGALAGIGVLATFAWLTSPHSAGPSSEPASAAEAGLSSTSSPVTDVPTIERR